MVDKIRDFQVDEITNASNSECSTTSDVYEADFSSHMASVQWPQRRPRPESRAPSVYSFHESLDGHLFRELHGRTFSNKNEAYFLPADAEEHHRLDKQHTMIQGYLGALYPARDIVEELLRPKKGYTPKIIDIGTGSGAWAIDMSLKFPHCEVIGVDLIPPKLQCGVIPDNCRFEIDDGNLSFTHWSNMFDFVHVRGITGGIYEFPLFINNMAQIMKPGALLVLGNGLLQFYDEYGKPYRNVNEGEEGFSWLQKWFMEVQNAYFRNNTTSFRAVDEYLNPHKYWHQWLESNPNFANVISWDMIVRLGNWSSETRDDIRIANDYCQSTVINLIKSFVPLLLTSGQPPELVEHWRMEATKELQELRLHSYGKWRWTWCIRTDCEWIPRNVDT